MPNGHKSKTRLSSDCFLCISGMCSCLFTRPMFMSLSLPFPHLYNHLHNIYLSFNKIKSCFPSLGAVIMGAFTVWTCWVLCIHNLLKAQGLFSVLSDSAVIVRVEVGRGPWAQVPASCWGSWSIEHSCLMPSSLLCRSPCLQVRPMCGMLPGTLPLSSVMPTGHTWMICSQIVISPREWHTQLNALPMSPVTCWCDQLEARTRSFNVSDARTVGSARSLT